MTIAPGRPAAGFSDETLLALPTVGKSELVNGKIIMGPASFDHGFICSILLSPVLTFALDNNLGVVVDSSTGFRLGNNLFSPDVSFVSSSGLQTLTEPLRTFFDGAADLAVEGFSPRDSREDLDDKIAFYFQHDSRLVWIIDPLRQSVDVCRRGTPTVTLDTSKNLSGEDVLPGFTLPVSTIFRTYSGR